MSFSQENCFQAPNQAKIAYFADKNHEEYYCSKHPDKKAKYLIKDHKLCSKCMINSAIKEGKLELDLSNLGDFPNKNRYLIDFFSILHRKTKARPS